MKKIVNMAEMFGPELFARSKAFALNSQIEVAPIITILNFNNVLFVSRSFADELCGILERASNVRCENMLPSVEEMISTVASSRKKNRERGKSSARFFEFDNVETLSEFILA